METKRKNDEPQIKMGLKFSGSKVLEYLRHRLRTVTTLLDQYTFWRSPILWLILFMNVVFTYVILTQILKTNLLPPSIPLFYYTSKSAPLLIEVDIIPYIIVIYLSLQMIGIFVASKLYFRLKTLSTFTLLVCILATFLFYLALYKSITLTLPLPL